MFQSRSPQFAVCRGPRAAASPAFEQRAPTPGDEPRNPEHGGNCVDRNEHPEEQGVIDERCGVLVDRNRRDRAVRVLHEVKESASQHQVKLVEDYAGRLYGYFREYGRVDARLRLHTDEEAQGSESK